MKKINKIKNKFISRQMGVAKLALKMGKDVWSKRNEDLKNKLSGGIGPHVELIANELGVMKGSLMKAGQLLSTYAGAFLPPEAQKVLKQLENQSYYLDWEQVKTQVPIDFLDRLEIEEEPIAAASLGQVHLATYENARYAMKIQYKGVRKAIKNDVKALKMLMKILNVIPKEVDLREIYEEIEDMLFLETNYIEEAKSINKFRELLKDYPQFKVPDILEEFSNEKVLTMEYLDGHSLRELENLNLSQDDRNELGREFMRLMFLELFHFKKVQTDVHMGNYILLPNNQWGLIDFGASKTPPDSFLKGYQTLIIACANLDRKLFFQNLYDMDYLSKNKETNEDFFWEYARIIAAPFQDGVYDWGRSNVADKVMEMAPRLMKEVAVGNPSRHTIFLDRKIGGVFFVLQKLEACFDVRSLLKEVLEISGESDLIK
ncbi:ABC1 kinase family protein [Halobacteriovorax sp. DPLXC-1]|uniref:ABC1 kinase family protein n=1 Tax=Halobacteriovorax sp. DPLXC-1 TaxID=3110771 RepID=UPI002FF10368